MSRIDKIIRDKDFFSRFDTLKAESLDSQFNLIVDFINKKIKPVLDSLANGLVQGSANRGDANKVFINNIDQSITLSFVKGEHFDDGSIDISKLRAGTEFSVIGSDNSELPQFIKPKQENTVLVSDFDIGVNWGLIKEEHIENNTITGDKVALKSLTEKNLGSELKSIVIDNQAISNEKFVDRAITGAKIKKIDETYKGITAKKFTATDLDTFMWRTLYGYVPENYIDFQSLPSDVMEGITRMQNLPKILDSTNIDDPLKYATEGKLDSPLWSGTEVRKGAIDSYYGRSKIQNNSINGGRFTVKYSNPSIPYPSVEILLAKESVEFRHLHPTLRLQIKK